MSIPGKNIKIRTLAQNVLTSEDYPIVDYLYDLISNEEIRIACSLIENIFPQYWTLEGGLRTLWPDDVYRTIYYLTNAKAYEDSSRHMINMMGGHLEGLLYFLDEPNRLSLGPKIHRLKKKHLISETLASQLLDFNGIYRRSKHMSGDNLLPKRLDIRTFSTFDTLLCLFVMRRLSMRLFSLLSENGISLPQQWKPYTSEWLCWKRTDIINPIIPQRQHQQPNNSRTHAK